ncbi:MAG TPA: LPS assembly lipoprotein LptE [Chlamydiales bacterium]|nr:LPS assembly lipoprotein LptE [Chlamydiales bacterium]
MTIVYKIFAAAILLYLSSCGYRWNQESSTPTVVVPYIVGDDDGTLTAQVIRTLTATGSAKVLKENADYLLKICISQDQNETVGYRRDKQKVNGKISKNIVSCEGRRTLSVNALLYEGLTDTIVAGPFIISADSDYDYVDGDSIQDLAFLNSDHVFTKVLPFSLGQLESIEAAQEATSRNLYEKLAQKIADTIFLSFLLEN